MEMLNPDGSRRVGEAGSRLGGMWQGWQSGSDTLAAVSRYRPPLGSDVMASPAGLRIASGTCCAPSGSLERGGEGAGKRKAGAGIFRLRTLELGAPRTAEAPRDGKLAGNAAKAS